MVTKHGFVTAIISRFADKSIPPVPQRFDGVAAD
jgi:hypothetical protein